MSVETKKFRVITSKFYASSTNHKRVFGGMKEERDGYNSHSFCQGFLSTTLYTSTKEY